MYMSTPSIGEAQVLDTEHFAPPVWDRKLAITWLTVAGVEPTEKAVQDMRVSINQGLLWNQAARLVRSLTPTTTRACVICEEGFESTANDDVICTPCVNAEPKELVWES